MSLVFTKYANSALFSSIYFICRFNSLTSSFIRILLTDFATSYIPGTVGETVVGASKVVGEEVGLNISVGAAVGAADIREAVGDAVGADGVEASYMLCSQQKSDAGHEARYHSSYTIVHPAKGR